MARLNKNKRESESLAKMAELRRHMVELFGPAGEQIEILLKAEGISETGDVDFVQRGITPDAVPMLEYLALHEPDFPETMPIPEYAVIALGQLKSVSSIPALIKLASLLEADFIIYSLLVTAFADIGPASIPALKEYFFVEVTPTSDDEMLQADGPATFAQNALTEIAERYPDELENCAEFLREAAPKMSVETASFIYASLMIELHYAPALPDVEKAFREDQIDTFILDWPTVAGEFGLDPNPDWLPENPIRGFSDLVGALSEGVYIDEDDDDELFLDDSLWSGASPNQFLEVPQALPPGWPAPPPAMKKKASKKDKNKRKQQKKSKKANRRR